MATIAILQDITDAWGRWFSAQHGTSCRFTSSTRYDDQGDLGQYHQYETKSTYLGLTYDPAGMPIDAPDVTFSQWFDNGTTAQQSLTFSYSTTTKKTFSLSVTAGLKISDSLTETVKVPAVADVSNSTTMEVSFSTTTGASTETDQQWSIMQPVVVPPNSSVEATAIINAQKYNINYTAQIQLVGFVAIWNNDKIDFGQGAHWLWFWPIEAVINDCRVNNLADVSNFVIGGGGVIFNAAGTFEGGQGVRSRVRITQQPYRSSAQRTAAVSHAASQHSQQSGHKHVITIPTGVKAGK